mgnify:CR=1 FL=1
MSNDLGFSGSGIDVFTSLDNHFAISDALAQSLKTTKKSLLISSPWIGKGFVDLIRRTVPDGVTINILTRRPQDNYDNSYEAVCAFYELCESHKWHLEVNCTSKHHPKFLVIDNNICVAGSLNPTESGIYYNLELGFVLRNPFVIKRVTDFFFKMWQRSVSFSAVKKYSGLEDLSGTQAQVKIAERIIGFFFGNGNTPTLKWKIVNNLKSIGFQEKDIVEVERYLIKRGTLYEPRLDFLCLACIEEIES